MSEAFNRQQEKLSRLINLTLLLVQTPRPLTAEEIRKELSDHSAYASDQSLESFRQAFERDKKDLRSMGIPITTQKWEHGDPAVDHYNIDLDRYVERDIRFSSEELAVLNLAAQRIQLPGVRDALIKAGIAGDHSSRHPSRPRPISGEIPYEEAVGLLASAAARRKAVEFKYQRQGGETTTRTVEPWRMAFSRGRWYFVGWDHLRNDERTFRIDRIVSEPVEVGKATQPRSAGRDLTTILPWDYSNNPPVQTKILVDAPRVSWAEQTTGVAPELQDDGSAIFTLLVRDFEGLRGFVLGLMQHGEILEPSEFRTKIIDWLKAQA